MNIGDLPENSDSSDEDYVPENSAANLPSEEESDGDAEDTLTNSDESTSRRSNSKLKNAAKSRKKLKTPSNKETETQSTDDLWADFKKDTGFKTRAERQLQTSNTTTHKSSSTLNEADSNTTQFKTSASNDVPKKVKVTEILHFAGEEIKVEKEVSVPSASKMPTKRSGLSSVLNNIGKKTKISTLEKSKLDWDRFKKEENIEDELQAYGKSKDGFLEKQDFLQRADLRQFEIEKNIRSTLRSSRMNNL